MIKILILIFFLIPGLTIAADLRFYGDVLLSRGIGKLSKAEGKRTIINHLEPFLANDAIHIANLEGAVGDVASCAENHKPCFPIERNYLDILEGFDVVNLENNHSLDIGLIGFNNTIKELKTRNIIPLGGKNYSAVIETENGHIGIVGITDVVNSVNDRKYLIMADSDQVTTEIRRLRKITMIVAVFIHWGKELDNLHTQRMKILSQTFIESGADIVVGTHPHVTGKVECIKGKPVIYSLGNFLFDQKYEDTKKGAILNCSISKEISLHCNLIGTETPANYFLPNYVNNDIYKKENEILSSCQPPVQQIWSGIFSSDRKEKKLLLKKDESSPSLSYLELYDLQTGKREIRTPSMPIEKLQTVDINADGIAEIMLIQNVYSSLDNEVAKRVYIYSLDKIFHALWRGSALSRPLEDAIFIKGKDNKPVLVALHSSDSFLLRNPKKPGRIIMSYRWNGFGFSGIKELRSEINSYRLSFSKGKIKLIDKQGGIAQKIAGSDLN